VLSAHEKTAVIKRAVRRGQTQLDIILFERRFFRQSVRTACQLGKGSRIVRPFGASYILAAWLPSGNLYFGQQTRKIGLIAMSDVTASFSQIDPSDPQTADLRC
jgi:hypothetical protein